MSRLRLINVGEERADVTITGIDDEGEFRKYGCRWPPALLSR
ncbi:MAG: hypothetical protein OXK76_12940 [Gammaproteobacteria bacterium]|nr:hypothetical protein [Gammaproteobacteria bacterium]